MDLKFDLDVTKLAGLRARARAAERELREDLRGASMEAAADGINAFRASHPYTDRSYHLTDDAKARVARGAHIDSEWSDEGIAEMVWPAKYASFVDGRGYDPSSEPSGAYAFTPLAREVAKASLHAKTMVAIERFRANVVGA